MKKNLLLKKAIVELTSAKQEVRKSESRFSQLFEIVPEPVALVQLNPLRFVKLNTSALQLLECPQEMLLQMSPLDISPFFQPDGSLSAERSDYYIQQTLDGEKPVFEWLLETGTGKHIYVEAHLALLTCFEEPLIYVSFLDITARKIAEMRLQEQNRNLQDIAFLQSHQVRQPVAQILGLINLLKSGDADGVARDEIVDLVYAAAGSFDEIIKEIVLRTHRISGE